MQTKQLLALLVFGTFILSVGCQGKKDESADDLRPFYFPVEELKEGKVYVYHVQGDSMPDDYWYYTAVTDSIGQAHLIGTSYSPDFRPMQMCNELIREDGSVMHDSRIFEWDTFERSKTYKVDIKQSVVFPFRAVLSDSLAYRYHIKYQEPYNEVETFCSSVRDRFFVGYDVFEWQGKSLKCVKMRNKNLSEIETPSKGGHWKTEFETEELYAEGLGLVKTTQYFKGKVRQVITLSEILSMPEFEKMAGQSFGSSN